MLEKVRQGEKPCSFNPHQLVSLIDMLPIARYALHVLEIFGDDPLITLTKKNRFLVDHEHPIKEEDVKEALLWLDDLSEQLQHLNCQSSLKQIERIRNELSQDDPPLFGYYGELVAALRNRITDDLDEIMFGFIPSDKVRYFKQGKLFGEDVYNNFESTREEIQEAGNCYAHGLNTACVFHCMRVVEAGVKAMHWQLTKRKSVVIEKYKKAVKATRLKSKPIKLCEWNSLINGLNLLLDKMEKKKSTPANRKTLAYYGQAVKIFNNFRVAWRNNISHGNEIDMDSDRKLFREGETEDILKDTKRFMQHLAKRVKE